MDSKSLGSIQNLELQLSELEMLSSMFPNDGEFQIIDPGVVSDIQDFIAGKIELCEVPKLEYILTQEIGKDKVEINISLPHNYPEERLHASVHCPMLNRDGHENINLGLKEYLSNQEGGVLCIATLIEWLNDNFERFLRASPPLKPSKEEPEDTGTTRRLRLWIQSHHIYSKVKMQNIQEWAKQYCLAGFLLPGKPGFICIEGEERNCQLWWQQVRSMNWQKITCRLEERDSTKKFRVFENIMEIRTSEQSDMKAFLRYLQDHASSHVFKEFFGFEGK